MHHSDHAYSSSRFGFVLVTPMRSNPASTRTPQGPSDKYFSGRLLKTIQPDNCSFTAPLPAHRKYQQDENNFSGRFKIRTVSEYIEPWPATALPRVHGWGGPQAGGRLAPGPTAGEEQGPLPCLAVAGGAQTLAASEPLFCFPLVQYTPRQLSLCILWQRSRTEL
jgi:hypothetical protein